MDNLVRELEKIPLTGNDLIIQSKKMGNANVGWILYDDLVKFETIDQLLATKNTMFILLQIKNKGDIDEIGHWISVSKDSSGQTQYYDPYGLSIEEDLAATGESGILLGLIKNSSNHSNINVNKIQHQELRNEVNVCGRHTVVRSIFHYLNNDQYNSLVIVPLIRSKQVHNPDVLVALMTAFLTNTDNVAKQFFLEKKDSAIDALMNQGRVSDPQSKFRSVGLPVDNIGLGGRVV